MGLTSQMRALASTRARLVESYDLSIDGPQPLLNKFILVRVPNDMASLEITVSDYPHAPGVVVSALGAGTAARAGLVVGDVITSVNSEPVSTHSQALQAMRDVRGAEIVFSLDGKAKALTIDRQSGQKKLEVTLSNPRTPGGVMVESVGLLGFASMAGLHPGDRVLSINGTLVDNHAQAIALMDSTEPTSPIELTISVDEFDVRV